jgi:hypothetical protein
MGVTDPDGGIHLREAERLECRGDAAGGPLVGLAGWRGHDVHARPRLVPAVDPEPLALRDEPLVDEGLT